MYGIIPKQSSRQSGTPQQGQINFTYHMCPDPHSAPPRSLSFRRVLMFVPGNNNKNNSSNSNNNNANLGQTINSWHLIKGENLLKASKGFVFSTQAKQLTGMCVCVCACVFNLPSSSHCLSSIFAGSCGTAAKAAASAS